MPAYFKEFVGQVCVKLKHVMFALMYSNGRSAITKLYSIKFLGVMCFT